MTHGYLRGDTAINKTMGLLAVDVDGTLITDDGIVTDEVFSALERVVRNGWELLLASGRTYKAARPVIEKLPFLRFAAVSNGACIVDVKTETTIYLETIPPQTVEFVVRTGREYGAIPTLYDSSITDQKVYYDSLDGACSLFTWYVEKDTRSTRVDDVLRHADDVLQIGMLAAKDIIFSIRNALESVSATIITVPFENTHFGGKNHEYWVMQVVGVEARKDTAIKRVARLLSVPDERVVAVGDNYNDADMLSGASIGVAMGNAPDEIKKLAKVVVASNNRSGLAQVVDDIIFSGKYFS